MMEELSFLLSHETLAMLSFYGHMEILSDRSNLDSTSLAHLRHCEACVGEALLGLALWGDGVPYSWDRHSSMEAWIFYLPGISHAKWKNMRLPFTAFPGRRMGPRTQPQVLEVFRWSLEALLSGQFPTHGPGGREFDSRDAWRKKRAGTPLGVRAILCQIRGDWKAFKINFGLPGWRERGLNCWKCKATSDNWLETGTTASMWRPDMRLSQWELLTRLKQPLSPVWAFPFMNPDVFCIDWLHAVDKGVALFFLGGVFQEALMQPLLGPNQPERLRGLWRMIQEFYVREKVPDRLGELSLNMVRNGLSALGAAEVRALVPFGESLTGLLANGPSLAPAEHFTMHEAMVQLHHCYKLLSRERLPEVEAGALRTHGLGFHELVVALHNRHPDRWILRPKHHIFLELVHAQTLPSLTWTYRDESFGGSLQHQAHIYGGQPSGGLNEPSCALQILWPRSGAQIAAAVL